MLLWGRGWGVEESHNIPLLWERVSRGGEGGGDRGVTHGKVELLWGRGGVGVEESHKKKSASCSGGEILERGGVGGIEDRG